MAGDLVIFHRLPNLVPQCPIQTCQAVGGFPQHVITVPDQSQPWKQTPIGFAYQCWRCASFYARTVQGTFLLPWMGAPVSSERLLNSRPESGESLDEMLADMKLAPRERGV